MNVKSFFYGTPNRRLVSRFLEVFILAGGIGLLTSPQFIALGVKYPLLVALGAVLCKFLRERFLAEKTPEPAK